ASSGARKRRSASRSPRREPRRASAPTASAVASRRFWRSQGGSALEERALTEELIRYDTSTVEGIKLCAGFVKGWLEARDIVARQVGVRDLPVTIAEVGPDDAAQTVLLHGHVDVVPGHPEQFRPRRDGDRLD